jgi:hypothetical protein
MNFKTNAQNLKWMILQTENNNERLQKDLVEVLKDMNDFHKESFMDHLMLHTLETDDDMLMHLSPTADCDNYIKIKKALDKYKPDIVVVDPLRDFAAGTDLNTDKDMTATCRVLGSLIKSGNPNRALIIIHHSQTGKAGISKVSGFDAASFGRGSKVLHGWSRAALNIAPLKPDFTELVIACGKNNDGPQFQPFVISKNIDEVLFKYDRELQEDEVDNAVSGKAPKVDRCPPNVFQEIFENGESLKANALARKITEETGLTRSNAFLKIYFSICCFLLINLYFG